MRKATFIVLVSLITLMSGVARAAPDPTWWNKYQHIQNGNGILPGSDSHSASIGANVDVSNECGPQSETFITMNARQHDRGRFERDLPAADARLLLERWRQDLGRATMCRCRRRKARTARLRLRSVARVRHSRQRVLRLHSRVFRRRLGVNGTELSVARVDGRRAVLCAVTLFSGSLAGPTISTTSR